MCKFIQRIKLAAFRNNFAQQLHGSDVVMHVSQTCKMIILLDENTQKAGSEYSKSFSLTLGTHSAMRLLLTW